MKRFAALILWLAFSIAGLLAIPKLLYYIFISESDAKRLGRAMDCVLAAVSGFSGKFTLSAELGVSNRLRFIYKLLNAVDSNHCEDAAISEGLRK